MKRSKKGGELSVGDDFFRSIALPRPKSARSMKTSRRRAEARFQEDPVVAHRKRYIFCRLLRIKRSQRPRNDCQSQKTMSLLVAKFARCFGNSRERNDCFARSETCEVNRKLDKTGNCSEIGLSAEGSTNEAFVKDSAFFSLQHVMETQVPRSPSESSPTCTTESEFPRKLFSDPGSHCIEPVCIRAQMVMVTNDHDSSKPGHVYYELRPQWLQRCVEELNDCTDGSPLHPQHPLRIPICKENNKTQDDENIVKILRLLE